MKIIVIGGGFSGLATASLLGKAGHEVTLLEKNKQLGGRAMHFSRQGFMFDMGPSWYMMPDLFDRYFSFFNKKPSDYYKIIKLKTSYEIVDHERSLAISSDVKENYLLFESIESGAGEKLKKYLENGHSKYQFAKKYFLFNNYHYILKTPLTVIIKLITYRPWISYDHFVNSYFKTPALQKTLKFMTVFLGGSPQSLSSLYSLLGYADMKLGIWYPVGGFKQVVKGFEKLAKENNVTIKTHQRVQRIIIKNGRVQGVKTQAKTYQADIVVSSADYHFTEQHLIPKKYRSYSRKYWRNIKSSPSGLMFFIGLNKKILGLNHHTMFFDVPWEDNFEAIGNGRVTENPLFYLSSPSVSDSSVAPKNSENLFILVPIPVGLKLTKKTKQKIFNNLIIRIEKRFKTNISNHIILKEDRASEYFSETFHSYQGNAFGPAHTLRQSSVFRLRQKSKKIKGLYFAGQYTNPGTGVPLVVSSAELVANYIEEDYPNEK